MLTPFASAVGVIDSTESVSSGPSDIRRGESCTLPRTMRETSSRSLTICTCAVALRWIVSSARITCLGCTFPSRSIVVQPRIALRGVRSSCDRVARNSSFRRLAVSASSRASANAFEQIAQLVLTLAAAHRAADEAERRAEPDGALEQHDVAQPLEQAEGAQDKSPIARRRQTAAPECPTTPAASEGNPCSSPMPGSSSASSVSMMTAAPR